MRGVAVVVTTMGLALVTGCGADKPLAKKDQEFLNRLVLNQIYDSPPSDDELTALVRAGHAYCRRLEDPSTTRGDIRRIARKAAADMAAGNQRPLQLALALGTAAQVYCPGAARRLR
jgi:hypothetical protein